LWLPTSAPEKSKQARSEKRRLNADPLFQDEYLRPGEFFTYLLIYLGLIIVNFLLSASVIYQLRLSPFLTLAIALIVCIGALTIWFLWTSLRILQRYTANSGEMFDTIWREVKEEGKDD
jgi:hypothetical protein